MQVIIKKKICKLLLKKLYFFSPSERMSGKSVNFADTFFYKNKKLFKIDDIDVDKIVVSKNESFRTKISLKHFI